MLKSLVMLRGRRTRNQKFQGNQIEGVQEFEDISKIEFGQEVVL